MRVLSLEFREALFAQESGKDDVPIFLLTITHPQLVDPIRLSTDPTARLSDVEPVYGTVSRAQQFIYAGINVVLPDEQDRAPPASKLIIPNVRRDILPLARSISSPAQAMIEAVRSGELDTVEMAFPRFDMTNLSWDAPTLTFDLTNDALATEPYPAGTFSPADFPGLF